MADLRRLSGTPAAVFADPALMRTLLPTMQADATLYRNYIYTEDAPLDIPIRAYGGVDDPNVRAEHLEAWREQTSQSFAVRIFPGGHFYIHTSPADLRAALETDLTCRSPYLTDTA